MHRSAGTAARSIDRTEFPTSPAAPLPVPANSPAVTLLECLGEARSRWLQLQAAGIYSHYQRFDWLEAWHVHVGSALGVRPLVLVGEDASGPAMILPLALNRRGGATVLEWMGWQQGNQNTGLWRSDAYAAADPVELSRLLLRTARQAGASLVDLRNIPLTWEGRPHPLAHKGTPAKDTVFRGTVAEPFATLRTRLQSKDSRKKDARKQKALEALPGFAIRTLETAASGRNAPGRPASRAAFPPRASGPFCASCCWKERANPCPHYRSRCWRQKARFLRPIFRAFPETHATPMPTASALAAMPSSVPASFFSQASLGRAARIQPSGHSTSDLETSATSIPGPSQSRSATLFWRRTCAGA